MLSKDKTVGLVKTSLEITQEIPVNQPAANFDYAGVDMVEDLTPEAEEDSPAITPPQKERTQKPRPSNRRKAAEKGRVKRNPENLPSDPKVSLRSNVCITLIHQY
jgi:hypothetical protein